MDEQSNQIKYLVVIATVICAVIIGYNAFYVPDAPLLEPTVTADVSSSAEEYSPSSVASKYHLASSQPLDQTASMAKGKATGKININTASVQQLSDGLKGIGDGLAERIVAYRKQHGPFHSIDQIKNVSGIGDKKYEEICSSLTVN